MNSIGCALLIFIGLATAVQLAVVFGTELLFALVNFGENTEKIISDLAGGLPYIVSCIITLLIYKRRSGKDMFPFRLKENSVGTLSQRFSPHSALL